MHSHNQLIDGMKSAEAKRKHQQSATYVFLSVWSRPVSAEKKDDEADEYVSSKA